MRNLDAVFAGIHQAGNMGVIILDHVTEDTAFNPLLLTELAHGDARTHVTLFVGLGNDLLPLGEIGQLLFQFRAADLAEEDRHVLFEESLVCIIEVKQPDLVREPCHRPADIDGAADHADAGTVA